MAHIQAFVVITLPIWAAVSVSGTTTELSTTAADTVNIPCLFGEGTVKNIFWYYDVCNGPQILSIAKGNLTIAAEYEDRASLQDDNSTLILKGITVADEGTYCCIVDRQGQIPVQNINTKLNVFSLRPDTLPVIPSCTEADESSSCSIHDNQTFTLNCTLPNVYPVEDTELIWYRDGKRVSSIDDVTQNYDGTTDISRQIKILETGNFTCNATYLSANGSENTAVSVEARIIIIPPTDVPETPGKNGKTVRNVGIAIGIVLPAFGIFLAIILCLKKRGQCCFREDNKKRKGTQHNEVELGSTLLPSSPVPHGISSDPNVTEKQLLKLAGCLPAGSYTDVAIHLDVSYTEHDNIKLQNQSSLKDAYFKMLMKWEMTDGGGKMSDLDEALKKANCGGLKYKDV